MLPDFDELMRMAESEPDNLESMRQKAVEDIISKASSEDQKRSLRGLQWKVDVERQKAKTPMAACIKISEMMHESFRKLRDVLNQSHSLLNEVNKDD